MTTFYAMTCIDVERLCCRRGEADSSALTMCIHWNNEAAPRKGVNEKSRLFVGLVEQRCGPSKRRMRSRGYLLVYVLLGSDQTSYELK
jgi:hypothetical protein